MRIVVKVGGRVQADPALATSLASMWSSGERICVVHGGGDEVSELQRQLGIDPLFVGGRRVTTRQDLALVRMALSGSANKRLVAMFSAAGILAAGISGEDGELIMAEPIDEATFGRAGKPVAVNTAILDTLFDAGFLPVVSPLGTQASSRDRHGLNINGDDAAAAIAAALRAELWLISDVAGVLDDDRNLLSELDPGAVESLVAAGTVNHGMQAKLEAGFAALEAGCPLVRVGSLAALSDRSAGTSLFLNRALHD